MLYIWEVCAENIGNGTAAYVAASDSCIIKKYDDDDVKKIKDKRTKTGCGAFYEAMANATKDRASIMPHSSLLISSSETGSKTTEHTDMEENDEEAGLGVEEKTKSERESESRFLMAHQHKNRPFSAIRGKNKRNKWDNQVN